MVSVDFGHLSAFNTACWVWIVASTETISLTSKPLVSTALLTASSYFRLLYHIPPNPVFNPFYFIFNVQYTIRLLYFCKRNRGV